MEDPRAPMTILGMFELSGPISVEEVRSVLNDRLLEHPRFRHRLDSGRSGRLRWREDGGFDLAAHVHPLDPPGSTADLTAILGDLAGTTFEHDRSPWKIFVIENHNGRAVLIPLLHHAIADGVALIQVLVSLCDDPPEHRGPPPVDSGGGRLRRGWQLIRAVLRLALLPRDRPTSLRADLSGTKRVAWSAPLDLDMMRRAAASSGGTVNDLVLSALAGAIRSELLERGETPPESIRAMVPFNLRPPQPGQPLGNRFGLVLPDLPVGSPDPRRRFELVRARMEQIKATPEAVAAFGLISMMGFSAAAVEAALVAFFGRKSSVVVTNVPGPSQRLHFAGRTIERLLFWVPQAGGIALGVSVMSYAGTVVLGVLSDTASLPDPDGFVRRFEAELVALGLDSPDGRGDPAG
jgi:diacylglycerol O-acyltransferase